MPPLVLGLDIGGANLKAATATGQARSVPFALWRQPDRLASELRQLRAAFPTVSAIAATMTGELCDCYRTKRDGVRSILAALTEAADNLPVRIWSTTGRFLTTTVAVEQPYQVAAANWHGLATFAGRYADPTGLTLLIDIGSTTTDIIPIRDGRPATRGLTDEERLQTGELVYRGVQRTPLCAMLPDRTMAELFATTLDLFLDRGELPDDPENHDTANGRPATRIEARGRLARMLGGDLETVPPATIDDFAARAHQQLITTLRSAIEDVLAPHGGAGAVQRVILSGAGEFLGRQLVGDRWPSVSLSEQLGPEVSPSAPAYALARLATEDPTCWS